jgi:hypothetical protein
MATSAQRSGRPPRLLDGRRCFSPAEANRALVLVKRILADITTNYARMLELQDVIDAAQPGGVGENLRRAHEEIVAVAEKLQHCVGELADVGVELRDWSEGIVDFPCMADGRPVCLCWRLGERRVAHWHEVGEGFAQRRSLQTLPEGGQYVGAGAAARVSGPAP